MPMAFPFTSLPLDAQKNVIGMLSSRDIINLALTNKETHTFITRSDITSTKGYKAATELSNINMVKVHIYDKMYYVYATKKSNYYTGFYEYLMLDAEVVSKVQKEGKAALQNIKYIFSKGHCHHLALVNNMVSFKVTPLCIGGYNGFISTIISNNNQIRMFYDFTHKFMETDDLKFSPCKDSMERMNVLKIMRHMLQAMMLDLISASHVFSKKILRMFIPKYKEEDMYIVSNLSTIVKSVNVEIKLYDELFLANSSIP